MTRPPTRAVFTDSDEEENHPQPRLAATSASIRSAAGVVADVTSEEDEPIMSVAAAARQVREEMEARAAAKNRIASTINHNPQLAERIAAARLKAKAEVDNETDGASDDDGDNSKKGGGKSRIDGNSNIKIVVVGDAGCGKTSFIRHYLGMPQNAAYRRTVGTEALTKKQLIPRADSPSSSSTTTTAPASAQQTVGAAASSPTTPSGAADQEGEVSLGNGISQETVEVTIVDTSGGVKDSTLSTASAYRDASAAVILFTPHRPPCPSESPPSSRNNNNGDDNDTNGTAADISGGFSALSNIVAWKRRIEQATKGVLLRNNSSRSNIIGGSGGSGGVKFILCQTKCDLDLKVRDSAEMAFINNEAEKLAERLGVELYRIGQHNSCNGKATENPNVLEKLVLHLVAPPPQPAGESAALLSDTAEDAAAAPMSLEQLEEML